MKKSIFTWSSFSTFPFENSSIAKILVAGLMTVCVGIPANAADKKKATKSSGDYSSSTGSSSSPSGGSSGSFSGSSSGGSSLFDTSAYSGHKKELSLSWTNSEINNSNNNTNVNLNGEFKYTIAPGMQAGGMFNMWMLNYSGTSNTYMGIWGSFTYNFNKSWDVADSFFATGAIGLVDEVFGTASTSTSNTTSEKKFSYLAYAGKRITLFNRINYVPQAGVKKIGSRDLTIVVIPLNFSILF